MPRVKSFFDDKSGIAEMDFSIFLIWGLWDTLLTAVLVFIFWLFKNSFGLNQKTILISSIFVWLAVFVIFWVATANMGLADWNALLMILPLAWFEMYIGTWIASKLYKRNENK